MPEDTDRVQLFGASVLAGIGFTMSLFIGMLAFPDPALCDLRAPRRVDVDRWCRRAPDT